MIYLINRIRYAATLRRANGLVMSDHYDEAILLIDEVLARVPDMPDALVSKGFALGFMKKLDEALVCADRALEIKPRHSQAWFLKGLITRTMGNNDEGLSYIIRAAQLGSKLARQQLKDMEEKSL